MGGDKRTAVERQIAKLQAAARLECVPAQRTHELKDLECYRLIETTAERIANAARKDAVNKPEYWALILRKAALLLCPCRDGSSQKYINGPPRMTGDFRRRYG
jgi:hypothetical protein